MEAMQCTLDKLARMEVRITSTLVGHCDEQSPRACTSSDDRTGLHRAHQRARRQLHLRVRAHEHGRTCRVAGLGRSSLSLLDQLSPQSFGTIHAHKLRADVDPCCAYRNGIQNHLVEAPSAKEAPRLQKEVVESSELESAPPPPVVYNRYIEPGFHGSISPFEASYASTYGSLFRPPFVGPTLFL